MKREGAGHSRMSQEHLSLLCSPPLEVLPERGIQCRQKGGPSAGRSKHVFRGLFPANLRRGDRAPLALQPENDEHIMELWNYGTNYGIMEIMDFWIIIP